MTPTQLAALKTEIQTDPQGLGYAACFPAQPGHAADLINAPTQTMVRPISSAIAMTWAAAGPYAAIVDASNNAASPCRASCLAILAAFNSGQGIDLAVPALASIIASWVSAGIITQAQSNALTAIATQSASRAQVLGFNPVLESDIDAALET